MLYVISPVLFLKLSRKQLNRIAIGVVFTYLGLVLFLTGVNVGFMPVGSFLGGSIASHEYNWILVPIAMVIGYFIVQAEPAVHVLNKQVEEFVEVTRVMSRSFLAVFRVNYVTYRYYMVKAENIGFDPGAEGDYDELLQQLVGYVEPEAAEEFAETFSRTNIKELVERNINDFGGEFRQRLGKGYKWVNVRLMRDELLKPDEAIFFYREVEIGRAHV